MNKKSHSRQSKILKRKCLVCGKPFSTTIQENGKYSNGHYFGKLSIPIEKGKYQKTGKFKFGKLKGSAVKWTGNEKKVDYWECHSCFEEAEHECWLEDKLENLFGKRCPDFEAGCGACQAWQMYDIIREDHSEQTGQNPLRKERDRLMRIEKAFGSAKGTQSFKRDRNDREF